MSAFMVSKGHIDALIKAGLDVKYGPMRWHWDWATNGYPIQSNTLTLETADEVGQMLWNENLKSIHARYPDTMDSTDNIPGPIDFGESDVVTYRFTVKTYMMGAVDPVKVLKAIQCYEYQSCEHQGWHKSEAFAYCEALRANMINRLAGYEDAPWSIKSVRDVLSVKAVTR